MITKEPKLLLSEFKEWFNQQDPNELAITDEHNVCATCLIARFISLKTGKPVLVGYTGYKLCNETGKQMNSRAELPKWAKSVIFKTGILHRNFDLKQFVNDLTE